MESCQDLLCWWEIECVADGGERLLVHEVTSCLLTEGHFVFSAVVAFQFKDSPVERDDQVESEMEASPPPDVLAVRSQHSSAPDAVLVEIALAQLFRSIHKIDGIFIENYGIFVGQLIKYTILIFFLIII